MNPTVIFLQEAKDMYNIINNTYNQKVISACRQIKLMFILSNWVASLPTILFLLLY